MTKCNICNKKINLAESIISKCECNYDFCSKHRMIESHNCSQAENIKNNSKKILQKNLPIVIADKLIKI